MIGLYLVALMIVFSVLYALQMFFPRVTLLKVASLTVLFMVASGIYFFFDTYKGWPSQEEPIIGSEVLAITIVEPEPGSAGAIHIWVVHPPKDHGFLDRITSYIPNASSPRAYELPYTQQSAEEYEAASKKLKKGYRVQIGEPNDQPASGDAKQGEGTGGKGSGDETEYRVPHLKIASPQESLRK